MNFNILIQLLLNQHAIEFHCILKITGIGQILLKLHSKAGCYALCFQLHGAE